MTLQIDGILKLTASIVVVTAWLLGVVAVFILEWSDVATLWLVPAVWGFERAVYNIVEWIFDGKVPDQGGEPYTR